METSTRIMMTTSKVVWWGKNVNPRFQDGSHGPLELSDQLFEFFFGEGFDP